jgi:hypothetical protein
MKKGPEPEEEIPPPDPDKFITKEGDFIQLTPEEVAALNLPPLPLEDENA